jgi:hypothetical protein
MRAGFAVLTGSLVLAFALADSLSAQEAAKLQVTPSAPDAVVAAGKVARADTVAELSKSVRPTDGLQSKPTGTSALTADECTGMDGSIVSNQYSGALCASKKMCVRTDNKGKTHAMCLEQ